MAIRLLLRVCATLLPLIGAHPLHAHSNDPDFMQRIGKMYVVVAVVLAAFAGIVLFLLYLDRRLTKLENQIKADE
ncbi:MAG: CcmD family protein [Saprospiraceae bacterium]|jgi:CcmD family protein